MKIKIHERRKVNMEEQFNRYYRLKEQHLGKISESMSDWADREVKLSIKSGNYDSYGRGCLESALKAYKSLCGDGHSGYSIGLTKQILNRLIDGLPLTAIEDVPENWNEATDFFGTTTFQSTRMPGLFKDIDDDGNVTYRNVDRAVNYPHPKECGLVTLPEGRLTYDWVADLHPAFQVLNAPSRGILNEKGCLLF